MHQEAASEIAGIEVYTETGGGKKDTNGCPVGRHSSKIIQERGGEKNLRKNIRWKTKETTVEFVLNFTYIDVDH